jgi:hypothetical protein
MNTADRLSLAILLSMRFIHALGRAIDIAINQQRFTLTAVVSRQVGSDCSFATPPLKLAIVIIMTQPVKRNLANDSPMKDDRAL